MGSSPWYQTSRTCMNFIRNVFEPIYNAFYIFAFNCISYRIGNWCANIYMDLYMSLFFFRNNFYKNKETFKIFSSQILEVYRILLVETTLESIMFYYTFSVINTMFVPYTALLYDSTAATPTLKLSITLLSISCGIHLIPFLMMSSLVCGMLSQTLSSKHRLRK